MNLSFLGTCKISKNCTATIKAMKLVTGRIIAEVCYTHYGHAKHIGHIWLPQKRRQEVANKIARGVTNARILSDIRESVHGSDHTQFQKVHLLGKEDLKNIRNNLGLHNIKRHANDQTSLLSWIQEWSESNEPNPVLYYKLQGKSALSTRHFKVGHYLTEPYWLPLNQMCILVSGRPGILRGLY